MMKNAPSDNNDDYDNDDDNDDKNLERTSAQGGQWTSSPNTIIWYAS